MERHTIDAAAIPPASDWTVIRIREAIRDHHARSDRQPRGEAITVRTYSQHVLQAGAL